MFWVHQRISGSKQYAVIETIRSVGDITEIVDTVALHEYKLDVRIAGSHHLYHQTIHAPCGVQSQTGYEHNQWSYPYQKNSLRFLQ